MTDILSMLWDSTDELHRRFDLFPPDPEATMRVFREEVQEFDAETIARYPGWSPDIAETCAEAADVMVTVLATLSGLGITRAQFTAACQHVARKNDAKTWDTHFIHPETGKIQRKVKAQS
jgi:hypothetical protein